VYTRILIVFEARLRCLKELFNVLHHPTIRRSAVVGFSATTKSVGFCRAVAFRRSRLNRRLDRLVLL